MKKLALLALLSLPSLAWADRLGSLNANSQVALSSQAGASFSITDHTLPMGTTNNNNILQDSDMAQLDTFDGLTPVVFATNLFGANTLGVGSSGPVTMYDADNSNKILFRAPTTVGTNYNNVFPATKLGGYEVWMSTGPTGQTVNLVNQKVVISTGSLQTGTTFYVSSGTIDSGGFRIYGPLDIDRPTLHGPFDGTSRMKFTPVSGDALLDLYSYNGIAPSIAIRAFNNNEVNVGSIIWTIASGSALSLRVSSCSTCAPQSAWAFSGQSGESSIADNQGNVFFTFNTSSTGIKGARPFVFYDSDSSNFVGFKASATVASNSVWVLPPADGTSGQAIITDGNKNLSFGSVSSVGGSTSTFNVFQYASTNTATVGGTTNETSLIGAGIGTLTFPANTFVPGYSFHVQAKGPYEQGSSTSLNLKLKLGGVTICESLGSQLIAGGDWLWDSVVTIRTTGGTGTLSAGCSIVDVGIAGSSFQPPSTATAAVNTTVANNLEFTGQFDTDNTTFTATNFFVNSYLVSTAAITLAGAQNTLEVFSPTLVSSPTYSISVGNGLTLTVSGSTAAIKIDFSTVASRGELIDKEFWWPAAATEPLEAPSDSVAPIVSSAGARIDSLSTDFDSAADECRSVNFGISTITLLNVSTISVSSYWYSASTGTGNVGWYFSHNNGVNRGEAIDVSTTTHASSFEATNATRSFLNITTWDFSLSSTGWVAGDWIEGLICRDANNASDTMSGDAKMVAFTVRFKRQR